jgi:hypothetical protein
MGSLSGDETLAGRYSGRVGFGFLHTRTHDFGWKNRWHCPSLPQANCDLVADTVGEVVRDS